MIRRNRISRSRLALLVGLLGLAHLMLFWRLADLQLVRAGDLRERAQRQHQRLVELDPIRGPIFDRHGSELALSAAVASVYADPSEVRSPASTARVLARALGVREGELRERLKSQRYFVWVKRKVSEAEKRRVESLRLPGVGFIEESQRFYPKRTLAAHVLGHVGMDNEGQAGLEFALDSEIRGQGGLALTLKNGHGQGFYTRLEREPTGGAALTLTLDEVLQHLAERELGRGVKESGARQGTAVILDPRSGAILAMANTPTYDPNAPRRYGQEAWRNRAVTDAYEPGSTFKVFSAAISMDRGLSRPEEWIHCGNGGLRVGRRLVRDHKRFGALTFAQVLEQSSNVGIMKVGLRLPPQRLYEGLRRFGFGERTGVELPGESGGILRRPAEWSGLSQAMMSMGQEVSVTPLQLAAAAAAVANGGVLRTPYLVERMVGRDGHILRQGPPGPGERVVAEKTAATLRRVLEGVVLRGTGRGAALPGYRVAGKTGTAQKIDSSGRYSARDFVASFVGWAPARDPAILILVILDSPRGLYHGGEVAAPVFARMALPALQYLRLPPDAGPDFGSEARSPLRMASAQARPQARTESTLR